jgi:hypothetical protein
MATSLRYEASSRLFQNERSNGRGGQFDGWSIESRDLRIRYLINLLQEHRLIAVGTTIPLPDYREIFYGKTAKIFDVPYFLMFHGLMAAVVTEFSKHRHDLERIDFVFDDQPGQMARLPAEWAKWKRVPTIPKADRRYTRLSQRQTDLAASSS